MEEWILSSVIFPLTPIPLVRIGLWVTKAAEGYIEIVRDGQLCFYSTSLGMVAVYDLWEKEIPFKEYVIPILLLSIMLSTFMYGVAITHRSNDGFRLALISALTAVTITILVGATRWQLGVF